MGFSFGNLAKGLAGGAIDTGPRAGSSFMSRLGSQMPGMINSMAGSFGDPSMQGAVNGASSLVGARKPAFPRTTNGIQGRMPGQNMGMPSMPPPVPGNPAVNTGPSPMMMAMPMGQGAGSMMGSRNTGVAGGMRSHSPMNLNNQGGLFGRFNRLLSPEFQ